MSVVSGVGLFSGLPTQDIIDQLVAASAGPLVQTQERLEAITIQRTAFFDLEARLLAIQTASAQFDSTSFLRRATAVSSDDNVLVATANEGAISGNYSFRVQSLVSSHQLTSNGFADADQTAVGAGTLSIEIGAGKLGRTTFLDDLNGAEGVGRGRIEIVDKSGGIAEIDLSSALTVDDVLDAINSNSAVKVTASVSGDRFVLTDTSGGAGNLVVNDLDGGTTAKDLGIAKSEAGTVLNGDDINDIGVGTKLGILNDNNGVRTNDSGFDLLFQETGGIDIFGVELNDRMDGDTHLAMLNDGNGADLGIFQIQTHDGSVVQVDLTRKVDEGTPNERDIQTIDDVITRINEDAGAVVSASLDINTNEITISDLTSGESTLKIENISGSSATDLGIETETDDTVIRSAEIYRMSSIGDVVRAINYATGNFDLVAGTRLIDAAVADNGLQIVRLDGTEFKVEAGNNGIADSQAAVDLGLLGQSSSGGVMTSTRLMAGLNTVLLRSLNGGQGVTLGTLTINDKNSSNHVIVLEGLGLESVGDVIEEINNQLSGTNVRAELNAAENGIAIVDDSGAGGTLTVSHVAADLTDGGLNLNGTTSGSTIDTGNMQLQYISENTLVADLNNGTGIGTGEFLINTRLGEVVSINISDNQKTIGDVIELINSLGSDAGIQATINSTGDGIEIIDSNTLGTFTLSIEDDGGEVAKKLNLLGEAVEDPQDPNNQIIDGSYEYKITIDADDTLNDVVDKINESELDIGAVVINDGSTLDPYRLSVTSGVTGTRGDMMFDWGDTGLAMSTLVKAQDAVVFFGGTGSSDPIVIRSTSNSLTDVIGDVTIDLVGTSDTEVELNVSQDVDSTVADLQSFVDAYNDTLDQIEDYTFFDSETLESGVLRSDPTVSTIETRLRSFINTPIPTTNGVVQRFSDIGVTFGDGGKLQFDETRFREVLADNQDAVEEFFTMSEINTIINAETGEEEDEFTGLGAGYVIADTLEGMTNSVDGLLTRKDDTLQEQEDLFNERAEQQLFLLDSQRERLELEFAALEQSLSLLSAQQSALSVLSVNASTATFGF